ncbi:hypothetical protein [Amycolatopsis pigmentata]|uniref:NACHT domain-containing protein n=1 Tax=Amycolatopsis pigmentata TaxID=450801 RepID=A0ABW5G203_9PSEU
MTTDHESSGSEQRHANTVDNTVRNSVTGPVSGRVVLAGSINQVSITESTAAPVSPVEERVGLLAMASRNQWTAAANDRRLVHPAPLPVRWRRSSEPVAGPVWAAGHARFDPLPGLTVPSGSELAGGDHDALHRIYGGLPSGRLLLIGKPGSGKSAAAILLLLDGLRYREQATPEDRARIPVPVLFTLHGWHPDRGESVTDWMAGKLAETYPMFHGRAGRRAATELLTADRVAAFLDGLDEIPETVRPGVLKALADAPFRLVLLTRTAEAVAAAHHGPLAGAVALELQPVHPTDAAAYLLQPLVDPPPPAWQTVTDHLAESVGRRHPASAVLEALATPLALSLLGDVYGQAGPVDELLDTARFPAAADIDNHLLDHAITAAYTPRPGHPRPRYSVATAHRTLRYLATELTERRTSDLAWWHIPTWGPPPFRVIAFAVTTVLSDGLLVGLPLGLVFGPVFGLLVGLPIGLMFAFVATLVLRAGPGASAAPQRITGLTGRSTVHSLRYGLGYALVFGPMVGLVLGVVSGPLIGLVSGLSFGLVSGLAGGAILGFARTDGDDSSLGPTDLWRHDRNALLVNALGGGLVIGLLAVVAVGLVPALPSTLASKLPVVVLVVLSIVLLAGLASGLRGRMLIKRMDTVPSAPGTAVVETALAAIHLAVRHKIPLRLLAFLEDARSKHLLRTVGPVYQFRHASLQARLAPPTRKESSRG